MTNHDVGRDLERKKAQRWAWIEIGSGVVENFLFSFLRGSSVPSPSEFTISTQKWRCSDLIYLPILDEIQLATTLPVYDLDRRQSPCIHAMGLVPSDRL